MRIPTWAFEANRIVSGIKYIKFLLWIIPMDVCTYQISLPLVDLFYGAALMGILKNNFRTLISDHLIFIFKTLYSVASAQWLQSSDLTRNCYCYLLTF